MSAIFMIQQDRPTWSGGHDDYPILVSRIQSEYGWFEDSASADAYIDILNGELNAKWTAFVVGNKNSTTNMENWMRKHQYVGYQTVEITKHEPSIATLGL